MSEPATERLWHGWGTWGATLIGFAMATWGIGSILSYLPKPGSYVLVVTSCVLAATGAHLAYLKRRGDSA